MKLLLDQNLSRKLIEPLSGKFPESRHVTDLGLDTEYSRNPMRAHS